MPIARKILEQMERSSWIRKMFETGNELKREYGPENVFDFSLGNPNVAPPKRFFETLAKVCGENPAGIHGYMTNAGYPEYRARVAEYVSKEHGIAVDKEQVIFSCGAGGGLNVVLKTLLNPGDEIVVPVPYFMEYNFYITNHGGRVVTVPCKENFDLDLPALAAGISGKTAAVLINSPNNPSGAVYPEETVRELGALLKEKSKELGRAVYLISDEPYRKIVFDDTVVPSVFASYRNSIVVTSHSKDLSIPGERIGYIAVHPEADDGENIINGAVLCTRILGFVNAPALMQRTAGELIGVSIDPGVYQRKRDLLCDGLRKCGYEFTVPKGTFYLLPKAPGGDELAFIQTLQRERILAVPGKGFGLPGYFRLAFCVDDAVIEGSIPGFKRAVEQTE